MRLRVVTVIIRPLSVTVQKQPFYNLFEKIAFPILCLTVIIYQDIEITHGDPDHIFLAIAQHWAMRLFVGFVMQGHIYLCYFFPLWLLETNILM